MKRFFLLSFMTIGIFLFLVQCKKEVDSTVKSVYPEEINIDELTSRFKSDYLQFKNGKNYKSGKVVTLSDAIYEMDATFNATYAKANHTCGEIKNYETDVTLNMENESEVDYDNVLIAYGSTIEKVSDIFYSLNNANRQLMMLSIEDAGSESAYTRKLIITATIGFGTYQGDFENSEKYLFNESATYNCDGDAAPGAPVIFETKINEHYNTCSIPCRYYFYGNRTFVTYEANSTTQIDITLDNYIDYKVFYANSNVMAFDPYTTECLEFNQNGYGIHEMQFYYDHYIGLSDDWMNSAQNTGSKRYTPESDIISFDTGLGTNRIIKHTLEMVFRKRGVMCTMVELLPER